MKRLALVLAASLTLAPSVAAAAAQVVAGPEAEVRLEAGKGRLVRLSRPAATVFIADPKVADVQVKSPSLVYVTGKRPGVTSLYAVDRQEQMIANLEISVSYDEGRLADLIRREVPRAEVRVRSANEAIILDGKVTSPADGAEVMRLARLFVDDKGQVLNRLMIDAPTQVNLRVRVAEVTKEASQQLGFNWESLAAIGAGGFVGLGTGADIVREGGQIVRPGGDTGALIGGYRDAATGDNINVMLEALKQKNLVTILAEPNLTAFSGEPASFLAGGEYPIPVPQGLNQITIEYKKFGVSLNFVATVQDSGRISLNVRPEVSQLSTNGAITLNGVTVPALTTRRAETTVELGSGQSFAIAGLLQNDLTKEARKFPGLGEIPLFGELLNSRRYQKHQSELIIIVTPYLVKPTSQRLVLPTDKPDAPPVTTTASEAPAAAPKG